MTLSISIDPDPHGSDHPLSDKGSSGVHVSVPSEGSHEYQDYDEWAHLPYPDEMKPSESAPRPRTSRSRPLHGSHAASGPRPASRRMIPERDAFASRGRRQGSPDSPISVESDEFPPHFERPPPDRRAWPPTAPLAPGYAHSQSSGPSSRRQSRERLRTKTASPDCILRSGDEPKNVTVHLDLDAAVDINPDLECLSRLNRLGHFKEAARLFEERLVAYVDFFPVVAEYADLLLEQGSFGHLRDFLSNRLDDSRVEYSDDEVRLMRLLRSLAEMYTSGALIPALEMTMEALGLQESKSKEDPPWSKSSIGIQIQLVEACLRIITYGTAYSTFLQNETFRILLDWNPTEPATRTARGNIYPYKSSRRYVETRPSRFHNKETHTAGISQYPAKNTPKRKYPQLGDWYRFLVREGFLWESHRILRSILPLLGDELCGQYTTDGAFEDFADLDELSKAPDVFAGHEGIPMDDEQLLFTELANASLLAAFFKVQTSTKSVLAIQRQFSKKAHYLATSIHSTYPHLISSRPYLNWVLLEATQGLWMSIPFQPLVVRSRLAPWAWSRDSAPRTQSLQPSNSEAESSLTQPEQTTAPSDTAMESRLKIVSESAKEIGDYHLQQSILQYLVQGPSSFERRLTVLQDLAKLCQRNMQDIAGYLQCLVDEYTPLYTHGFADVNKKRLKLHCLSEFDNTFPSRFDYDSEARQSLNIIFFDLPSLAWLRLKLRYNLLKSMGRNTEADLSTVRLRHIEKHVPRHMLPDLGSASTICLGCADCGGPAKQPSAVDGVHPPTSGASLTTPWPSTAPYQARQALADQSHRSYLAGDDIVRDLEKMFKKD